MSGRCSSCMRLALLIAVLLAVSSTAAEAAVTASPRGVRNPAVAVNAQGRVVVAWERLRGGRFFVEARTGAGLRPLGPVQRLGRRVGYRPQVAIGADGTAVVTWVGSGPGTVGRLHAAVARPGRPFGAVQTVDARRTLLSTAGVAVQPNGRAVVTYRRSSTRIGFALAARGRAFGRPRLLAIHGLLGAPSVALDPRDGAVLVAYGTYPSRFEGNTQAAVVTLGTDDAGFGAPSLVSGRDADEQPGAEAYPRVVAGPAGAALAFQVSAQNPQLVRVARRNADGSWDAALTASATDGEGGARGPGSVTAALPADGAVVAAWLDGRSTVGESSRLLSSVATAAIAPPAGPFTAPVALSSLRGTATAVDAIAVGATAYVAWATSAGGPVRLVRRAPGAAAFGVPRTLSAAGDGDALLASAGSRAIAAWQQGDRLRLSALSGARPR